MPKIIRDWLFIIFIILFIVITFFVALYAAGYTINRQWPLRYNSLFQKTGMLIVNSSPSGANIILDGERQNKSFSITWNSQEVTTPAKIKNLVPGKYTLRLEKDGYWPLEKKIEIRSGQSTFEEDFIIFKKSQAVKVINSRPQPFKLGANNRSIVLEDDALTIDLKTGSSSKYQDEEINPRNFPLETGASNLHWNQAKDRLYYQLEDEIRVFNRVNNSSRVFLKSANYLDYIIHQNSIYTIEIINQEKQLRIYSATSALLESSISLSPGEYEFEQKNRRLSLYDRDTKSLYILNSNPHRPIVKKLDKVNSWQWISDSFIVWHNDSEIYSMHLNSGRPNLIVRISDKITSIAWNQAKSYLIYSSADNIWIVNLNLEKIIPINILKANEISNLNLDEKNQVVYFYAKIDDNLGIYKLQLK